MKRHLLYSTQVVLYAPIMWDLLRRKKHKQWCANTFNYRVKSDSVVGIPRALVYYLHPGLWEAYFGGLGYKVVVSPETSPPFLEKASQISETEHCLPVKLLDAHVDWLTKHADIVLIPRILSTCKSFISCPKLSALPDAVRADFGHRAEILTVEIDARHESLRESLRHFAIDLGADRATAFQAAAAALNATSSAPPRFPLESSSDSVGRFLLLSHPYNFYVRYFTDPIVTKLRTLGVQLECVDFRFPPNPESPVKWDTCSIMHETLEQLDPDLYDGVLQLTSFNCGCDSVVSSMYRRILRRKGLPLMSLILDEHSAQAGVDTRLEAFVDSVLRPGRLRDRDDL